MEILALGFVVWLGSGLAAGWLAGEKRRSVGGWFLMGVLFGPLGVLLVGFAPAKDKPPAVDTREFVLRHGVTRVARGAWSEPIRSIEEFCVINQLPQCDRENINVLQVGDEYGLGGDAEASVYVHRVR